MRWAGCLVRELVSGNRVQQPSNTEPMLNLVWLVAPVGIVFEAVDINRPHTRLAIKRVKLDVSLPHCLTRAEQADHIAKLTTREVNPSPGQARRPDSHWRWAAPVAQVATATVQEGGAATTFHIQRRGNVESDNKPHKVTVMMTELESSFRYYAAPAVNPKAYLQCLTTNTTDFTLLPTSQVCDRGKHPPPCRPHRRGKPCWPAQSVRMTR